MSSIKHSDILVEIVKRADKDCKDLYNFTYYRGPSYHGADIGCVVFRGNFWQALLNFDAFLQKNTVVYYKPGYVKFIKNAVGNVIDYLIDCDGNGYGKSDFEDFITIEMILKEIEENLYEDETLMVRKLTVYV